MSALEDIKKLVNSEKVKTNEASQPKSKVYNATKHIIVGIVVFLAVIGVLGSTHWGIFFNFSMSDYTSFLTSFGGIFMTLIGSIGLGGAAKNGINALADYNKALKGLKPEEEVEEVKVEDDGRSLVTGGAK